MNPEMGIKYAITPAKNLLAWLEVGLANKARNKRSYGCVVNELTNVIKTGTRYRKRTPSISPPDGLKYLEGLVTIVFGAKISNPFIFWIGQL